jgi:hypothetical protein
LRRIGPQVIASWVAVISEDLPNVVRPFGPCCLYRLTTSVLGSVRGSRPLDEARLCVQDTDSIKKISGRRIKTAKLQWPSLRLATKLAPWRTTRALSSSCSRIGIKSLARSKDRGQGLQGTEPLLRAIRAPAAHPSTRCVQVDLVGLGHLRM